VKLLSSLPRITRAPIVLRLVYHPVPYRSFDYSSCIRASAYLPDPLQPLAAAQSDALWLVDPGELHGQVNVFITRWVCPHPPSWSSVAASFPPMAGFSTSTTVCGFAYGLEGFYVAGPATLVGSGLSFITLRLLKRQITSWTSKNQECQALEQVIVIVCFLVLSHYYADHAPLT